MRPDGTYVQREPTDPTAPGTQQALMQLARYSVSASHTEPVRRGG